MRDWKQYHTMSPFEIKNELIEIAEHSCKEKMEKGEKCVVYNVGRGNPAL